MSRLKGFISVILSLAALLSLSACEWPQAVAIGIPEPDQSVNDFFSNICSGDFENADRYLDGVSLRISGEFSGSFSEKLYHYLLKSYQYHLDDRIIREADKARFRVSFTSLSPALLAVDLKRVTTEIGQSYLNEMNQEYVVENNGVLSLSDTGAERTAIEALDQLMTSPEKYYVTNSYDLSAYYKNGKWYIIISDEFYNAVSGGFQEPD